MSVNQSLIKEICIVDSHYYVQKKVSESFLPIVRFLLCWLVIGVVPIEMLELVIRVYSRSWFWERDENLDFIFAAFVLLPTEMVSFMEYSQNHLNLTEFHISINLRRQIATYWWWTLRYIKDTLSQNKLLPCYKHRLIVESSFRKSSSSSFSCWGRGNPSIFPTSAWKSTILTLLEIGVAFWERIEFFLETILWLGSTYFSSLIFTDLVVLFFLAELPLESQFRSGLAWVLFLLFSVLSSFKGVFIRKLASTWSETF